jgi:mRNA interferase MazF
MVIEPGVVVTVNFVGATGVKRRPTVVISTTLYHQTRPDIIVGVLTTQVASATKPSDYLLRDWAQAGLHRSTAFRTYLNMIPATTAIEEIGRLSQHDWEGVQRCLRLALAVS